jgi:hypothetical protein
MPALEIIARRLFRFEIGVAFGTDADEAVAEYGKSCNRSGQRQNTRRWRGQTRLIQAAALEIHRLKNGFRAEDGAFACACLIKLAMTRASKGAVDAMTTL